MTAAEQTAASTVADTADEVCHLACCAEGLSPTVAFCGERLDAASPYFDTDRDCVVCLDLSSDGRCHFFGTCLELEAGEL